MAVEEVAGVKRTKVGDGDLPSPTSPLVQITTEDQIRNTRRSCVADGSLSSDRTDGIQFIDLEESVKLKLQPDRKPRNDRSTEELHFTDSEESVKLKFHPYRKPRIEITTRLGSPETVTAIPATVIRSRRTVPAEKLPPAAELEEFFASAEKQLHQRFKQKYNFDIVSDTPLEGRFEWIQLKP